MIYKDIIKKSFSKYAHYYDKYSTIQNLCALDLITKIETNGFSRILDIGCGTGNYTGLLKDKYPIAHIKAIDISKEMVKIARKKLQNKMIEFIIADAEVIDFKEQFDLITSNASFQWFEDLEMALSKYKNLLNRDGIISFSIFGPLTFYELNLSLKELFGKEASINSDSFIEKARIKKILEGLFKEADIEEKIYKEGHASLSELLKKIKYSGIRGNGMTKNRFWMPKTLDDLEKIYKRRFREIIATYQVFFCRGAKVDR